MNKNTNLQKVDFIDRIPEKEQTVLTYLLPIAFVGFIFAIALLFAM